MFIRITLDTQNDAFEGQPELEVARILSTLADQVRASGPYETPRKHQGNTPSLLSHVHVSDINGNRCGDFKCWESPPRDQGGD